MIMKSRLKMCWERIEVGGMSFGLRTVEFA